MVRRGLKIPTSITSDGAPGLLNAATKVFSLSVRIRCWYHKLSNIRSKLPTEGAEEVLGHIRSVRDALTLEAGEQAAATVIERFSDRYPAAIACLSDDLEASLAHLTLPVRHRINTRTTNLLERTFEEIATFTANPLYTPEDIESKDVALHSMGLNAERTRTYLAYLGGGFLILDSSDLAKAVADPKLELLTPVTNSPTWPNQTVHSAVKILGRDFVVTTDEIYGDLLDDFAFEDHGCPWGWVHIIDVSNEDNPQIVGEYKIEENTEDYCAGPEGQDPANTVFTSFSAHNPTVLENLGITTWHSGGLQAFDLTDPTAPVQTGFFSPDPLPDVDTEDVALGQGLNKVIMWSFRSSRTGSSTSSTSATALCPALYGSWSLADGRCRILRGQFELGGRSDAGPLGRSGPGELILPRLA